jgi:hypothetical protein
VVAECEDGVGLEVPAHVLKDLLEADVFEFGLQVEVSLSFYRVAGKFDDLCYVVGSIVLVVPRDNLSYSLLKVASRNSV